MLQQPSSKRALKIKLIFNEGSLIYWTLFFSVKLRRNVRKLSHVGDEKEAVTNTPVSVLDYSVFD